MTAEAVCTTLVSLLQATDESRIAIAGMSNLTRGAIDFRSIAPLSDTLEEQAILMRLFVELGASDDVHVSIGTENPYDALIGASMVAGTYRSLGQSGGGLAHLGIAGLARIDYARTMSAVKAVTVYLTRFLNR